MCRCRARSVPGRCPTVACGVGACWTGRRDRELRRVIARVVEHADPDTRRTGRRQRRPPPTASTRARTLLPICWVTRRPGKLMTRAAWPRCSMRRMIDCRCVVLPTRREELVGFGVGVAAQAVHEARQLGIPGAALAGSRRGARRNADRAARPPARRCSSRTADSSSRWCGRPITAFLPATRGACGPRGTGAPARSIRSIRSSRSPHAACSRRSDTT